MIMIWREPAALRARCNVLCHILIKLEPDKSSKSNQILHLHHKTRAKIFFIRYHWDLEMLLSTNYTKLFGYIPVFFIYWRLNALSEKCSEHIGGHCSSAYVQEVQMQMEESLSYSLNAEFQHKQDSGFREKWSWCSRKPCCLHTVQTSLVSFAMESSVALFNP